jgi:hypothetical protein
MAEGRPQAEASPSRPTSFAAVRHQLPATALIRAIIAPGA